MQLRCMVFLHVSSFPQNCHNMSIHIGPNFGAVIVGSRHSFCQNNQLPYPQANYPFLNMVNFKAFLGHAPQCFVPALELTQTTKKMSILENTFSDHQRIFSLLSCHLWKTHIQDISCYLHEIVCTVKLRVKRTCCPLLNQ